MRAQSFFSRKLLSETGEELTSLSLELQSGWNKLRASGGIIALDHPSKVFLDPTAVISLMPADI